MGGWNSVPEPEIPAQAESKQMPKFQINQSDLTVMQNIVQQTPSSSGKTAIHEMLKSDANVSDFSQSSLQDRPIRMFQDDQDSRLNSREMKRDKIEILKCMNWIKDFQIQFFKMQLSNQKIQLTKIRQNVQSTQIPNYDEPIFQILKSNFEVIETCQPILTQLQFPLLNKILIKKFLPQSVSSTVAIYISVFPILLKGIPQKVNISIGYKLDRYHNPCLIWFSLYEMTPKRNDLSWKDLVRENSNNKLSSILSKSIQYLKMTKVLLIYTTLSEEVNEGLHNLKFEMNNTVQIAWIPHIQTIFQLRKPNFLEEYPSFLMRLDQRINTSPNRKEIKQALNYFESGKNLEISRFAQNPRQLFENFCILKEVLSNSNKDDQLKSDTTFLCGKFFAEPVIDSISSIHQAFHQPTKFSSSSQLIVFVLCLLKERKALDSIISDQFNWMLRQEFVIAKTVLHPEIFSMNKLLKKDVFEFKKIIQQCPRLVIQSLYRIIDLTYHLTVEQYSTVVNQKTKQKFKVNYSAHQGTCFTLSSTTRKSWIWTCQCHFSGNTQIPCEHQLACAIRYSTSIWNLIGPKWKPKPNKQLVEKRQCYPLWLWPFYLRPFFTFDI